MQARPRFMVSYNHAVPYGICNSNCLQLLEKSPNWLITAVPSR